MIGCVKSLLVTEPPPCVNSQRGAWPLSCRYSLGRHSTATHTLRTIPHFLTMLLAAGFSAHFAMAQVGSTSSPPAASPPNDAPGVPPGTVRAREESESNRFCREHWLAMGRCVDFGKSYQMRQPVAAAIAERLPRTLALTSAGVLVQVLFGLCTGVVAALRRGSSLDRALVGVSLLGISAPTFLIALSLQYVLAYKLRCLPLDGFGQTLGEHLKCLVLPAITLGVYGAAYYTRLVRDEMIVFMRQDWVRTARAKGASPWRVVVYHALRNALVLIATAVGLDFGALMGGAVVTETVFRWPGLGDSSVKATMHRDAPVLLACVVVTSTFIVASSIVVDAVASRRDPRTRES